MDYSGRKGREMLLIPKPTAEDVLRAAVRRERRIKEHSKRREPSWLDTELRDNKGIVPREIGDGGDGGK